MTRFEWNYTTFLNIVFLGVAAVVYWAYRNRERLGGGGGYAKDPVCGMQVERANPGATTQHDGHTVFFCSDRCKTRFDKDPGKFETGSVDQMPATAGSGHAVHGAAAEATDPVCGKTVATAEPGATTSPGGRQYVSCSQRWADAHLTDPGRYLSDGELTARAATR